MPPRPTLHSSIFPHAEKRRPDARALTLEFGHENQFEPPLAIPPESRSSNVGIRWLGAVTAEAVRQANTVFLR